MTNDRAIEIAYPSDKIVWKCTPQDNLCLRMADESCNDKHTA